MCCYYKVNREFGETDVIPVGHPFKNTQILLLNEKDEVAGEGENGEICIRGTPLTLGYYNDFARTQEVFVQNPLNRHYPELIYRTGDIGKYNEYGELVFLFRKDSQFKHMGHRIEPGEIEAKADEVEEVRLSGCIHQKETDKIILFYVGDISVSALTTALKGKLPRYMMPNKICRLEQMPLTANGKIDRAGLRHIYI
jgi:acyl-coenzyme A synthetase/AMP-(fatty) acid ligase